MKLPQANHAYILYNCNLIKITRKALQFLRKKLLNQFFFVLIKFLR